MIRLILAVILSSSPGNGRPLQAPYPPASVGCFGDSISDNVCSQPVCVGLNSVLPAGYVAVSHAHSGESADQIAHRLVSEAASACYGEPCSTVVINGGTNTLKQSGFSTASPATVVDYTLNGDGNTVLGMLDGVDSLHQHYPHTRIVLIAGLPYSTCISEVCNSQELVDADARVQLYDVELETACAASSRRGWLRCVFPQAQFRAHPEWFCADGIHPNNDGKSFLVDIARRALNWP